MGADVVTRRGHVTDPVPDHFERGDIDRASDRQPARSKRPRCCHTIDGDRDGWAICGARLNKGHKGVHSHAACIKAGHRRCADCERLWDEIRRGDWS